MKIGVLGWITSDLKDVTYENVKAFAEEYFQPGNMIVSVVSPAPTEEINELFSVFRGNAINDEPSAEALELKLHDKEVKFDENGGGKRSFMFWGFIKEVESGDKAALKVLSLICLIFLFNL